jgi:hypothetical protein
MLVFWLSQLFWAKRLEGLFACDENGEKLSTLQLPSAIQGYFFI